MITHLNYIEDKELRDYIYDELNEIKNEFSYIVVDDDYWNSNKSKIYAFKTLPDKKNLFWVGPYSQQLFYDSKYLTSAPSVYDIFNTTRDIFDIEKILNNWREDQFIKLRRDIMITHLNYIEDKELRDELHSVLLEVFNKGNKYIAVDPEQLMYANTRIYAFDNIPKLDNKLNAYYGDNANIIDNKFIKIFNNKELDTFYDIEKILNNWREDQRDNNFSQSEDILSKILNNFGLKINSVFQNRNNNKFFRINKHADIEEYINNGWRVTNLYEFIDIIDDMYDDDYPTFKYNVEKQFEEFIKKENEKIELSNETKRVIKSIININYSFIKIHPDENKISIHKSTKHKPLFIYTNEETIEWFLNFIKENFINNDTCDIVKSWTNTSKKILYINKLKDYMKENHKGEL